MRFSAWRNATGSGRILLMLGLVFGLVATGATPALAQRSPRRSRKAAKAAKAPQGAMRLWIPAYIYPFGPGLREWNRLIASAKAVPIVVIVNPASGPGDHVDTNFAAVLPRARRAGITLVGYIGTQYGRKPLAKVQEEIATFLRFYPDIRGFHFDEQSSDARGVDYYAELYRDVNRRIPGALVLTNPGTTCDPGYIARPASDVVCLFENERGFDRFQRRRLALAVSGFEVLPPGAQRGDGGPDEGRAPARGAAPDRPGLHHG